MAKITYSFIYNRKDQLNSKGLALIQLRVYFPDTRENRYVSTGVYVAPGQWDQEKWVVNHGEADDLNFLLKKKIRQVEDLEFETVKKGETFTPARLKAGIEFAFQPITFLAFFEDQIPKLDTRITTKRQHTAALNHLKSFGKIRHFRDLTYRNIIAFDQYLHEINLHQNTIYSIHKRVKSFVTRAVLAEHITLEQNPYLKFKNKKGKDNEIRYLDEGELKLLEEKQIDIPRVDRVRDVFVFQCYTGLSYSDAFLLTWDNVYQDAGGEWWTRVFRQKTEEKCSIMLLPKAMEIIEKYKGKTTGDKLLPMISNQKMNFFLREMAGACGIKKHLTSHIARHTFATTVTLMNGVPLETVSRMLGHRSIKTTQVYSKVVDQKVRDDMIRLKEKMK